jgi:DNA-directed RNA polymerase subunit RPC12/RpoP
LDRLFAWGESANSRWMESIMTAITCAKCSRRFTPTNEEIQVVLAASQGQKHALLQCPYCGKANKVAPERLKQAVRFAPAATEPTINTDGVDTPS